LYYIGICQHKIDEEKVFHSLAGSERSKYIPRGKLQYHDDFGGDLVESDHASDFDEKMTSGRGREASLIAAWTAKSVSLNSQPPQPRSVRHDVRDEYCKKRLIDNGRRFYF